jgi:Osmosensitive K+ channel histidine kinase
VIAPSVFATIVLTTLIAALVVAAVTIVGLRVGHRMPILLRLFVVACATVGSIVAATVAIAREMYISEHDLIVLCWVIGVAAVVSLAVTALIGLGMTRSSSRLREIAHAIGDGELVHAEDYDSREFADLSRELAATSERLAKSRDEVARLDQSRRRLFVWVSHDLRTPLASLRAMAESLEDGVAADPTRYHRQIRDQVDTLSALVDDLFELSKIQSGTLSLRLERLSLFDLVSDAVADIHPLADARSIALTETCTGDLTVMGDARELARVIGNLLINAIQHSPDDSEIVISARETDDGRVSLSVTDCGGGIPETDLGHVFDAGWRGSSARTPNPVTGTSSGSGFGLAIVRGIVEAHAGEVTVGNTPGGCRFDIALPRLASR